MGILPGLHTLGGTTSASGALLTWFRNQFGQQELDAERALGLNAYQLLAQEAEGIPPGSEGLIALPHFAGERTPINDALARGMILGLTLSHTRRHVYRALLEGIAYGVRQMADDARKRGAEIARLSGENPARSPIESPLRTAAIEASLDTWNQTPVLYPWFAGSGPMYPLSVMLNIPVISAGATWHPDTRAHSPNENILERDYFTSLRFTASLIEHFSQV